jgi:hypothetical protein
VFNPPAGERPFLARQDSLITNINLRPTTALSIDNTYILSRYTSMSGHDAVFNNHILRSKWNYQFTRALSVRLIGQYTTLLANPFHTSIPSTKALNADFLVTYLIHPGTAFYVGYNSDLQNLDPALAVDPATGALRRTTNGFLNDGRQVFVKFAYQLRF